MWEANAEKEVLLFWLFVFFIFLNNYTKLKRLT